MQKDVNIFLEHILQSIVNVNNYLIGKDRAAFMADEELQDAIVRRLEIIGEAVRNIPEDLRRNYPDVPWQDVSDMRNKLIHEYFIVDMELVWQVLVEDLPKLERQLLKIKNDLESKH